MSVAAGRAAMRARIPRRTLALMALLAASTGCVTTIYQPLTSLQRPVAVDPRIANFEGQRLLLRCHPGDYLSNSDAQTLCRGVGTSFRNQGAVVDMEIPRPGRPARAREADAQPDLVIDLKGRLLHRENSNLLYILAYMTLTLVPAVDEFTFAQDVTIRDRQGTLLLQDSLQARFIQYVGVGVWAVNWALDVTVREDEDELSGKAPHRAFSRDFYGQLSQLAFNAHMRQVVLRGFEPAAAPAGSGK
jgi:hypothetical protein